MLLPPPCSDADYTRVRQHDLEELWDLSIAPHVATSYQARQTLMQDLAESVLPSPSNILDVGCAQGTFGLRMAERGHRVVLLDARAGHIEYARRRHESGQVEFRVGFLEQQRDLAGRFDLVVFSEVLEHVRSPAWLLASLRETLRPGGHLLITTPNSDYVPSRLPSYGRAVQEVIDHAEDNSADGDGHRFLYSLEELVAVVRASGLRVVRSGFFSEWWASGHLKTRYLHRLAFQLRRKPLRVRARLRSGPVARRSCAAIALLADRA
jgi:2-polyprenyl-6-hydroxyphenyl methylase/3-demethylubiquinone-9 3-methyltransferase